MIFSALRAGERANALLDRGSFVSIVETGSDVPFVVGSGFLNGTRVFVALTDGHVRGGTLGVREAGVLASLAHKLMPVANGRSAAPPPPLIIGFDTGGVRVQEGPRALAAVSAVGVALARLTLMGVRVAALISGPRGCFGAPAVMAALPERVIMTANAHWGLTGPKLLRHVARERGQTHDPYAATAAATRLSHGDVHAVIPDTADAARAALVDFVSAPAPPYAAASLDERIGVSATVTAALCERLRRENPEPNRLRSDAHPKRRRRDLLRYSFRGQWTPGPERRAGLVQASIGTLAGHPALGIIVGPELLTGGGVGIAEAAACTEMIHAAREPRTAILAFLFCQGHAVDAVQERYGLTRALAECLRAVVAARLRGNPVVSTLGGGTYGAAYLCFAAPSHRILALQGTSIAPMAPRVLRAFQTLRSGGAPAAPEMQLAELIPDIRIVESVIRLPRVLREELTELLVDRRP